MRTRMTPEAGEDRVTVAVDRFSVSPREPITLVGASTLSDVASALT